MERAAGSSMKIPPGTKSILCVCTGGKDRSPIMAEYFRSLGYEARAVGISEYHTGRNGTKWIGVSDLHLVDLIVVVSTVHEAFVRGLIRGVHPNFYHTPIRVVPLEGEGKHSKKMIVESLRDWVLGVMREAFPVSGG
jgi:hypothetical protein